MWLSVIVPVYNVKDYLEACVNSILANDCRDCEIILVDDGSTDGVSGAICDRLAQQHEIIRCIHQENGGIGAARNTGIEHALGEYLWFVDSDDRITPDAIGYLREKAECHQADVCYFDFYYDDGEARTPAGSPMPPYDISFRLKQRPELLQTSPMAWRSLWRKSLFTENGIRFPSRVFYEDLRTSLKLWALAGSIVSLPKPLYYYLNRPGSIMNTVNLQRNGEILLACEDVRNWFQEKRLYDQYRKQLDRIVIEHVFVYASLRVLKADPGHPLLRQFYDYTKEQVPDFRSLKYAKPGFKNKLVYWLLTKKQYTLLNRLFRI